MSSFQFDDVDEDHFLVRKRLHRHSLGDCLKGDQHLRLLHTPQLSSVLKKPIIYPPTKTTNYNTHITDDNNNNYHLNFAEQTNKILDNSQSLVDSTPLESSEFNESPGFIESNSISTLEDSFSMLSLNNHTPNNEADEVGYQDNDCHGNTDCHGNNDCQLSIPDSLEETDTKKIQETRRNQSEEFKVDTKNEADVVSAMPKSQKLNTSKRMNKIISYDEALNIPQTDDDKERMTTSRRKERPINLSVYTPARPTSARIPLRKLFGVEDRRESFLGSMQSLDLNSSKNNISLKSPCAGLIQDSDKSDFFRRTQSFRMSKSVGLSRRTTMGPELVNQIQESAKNMSSQFEHLSPKDQKVLAVLMAKREQEKEDDRIKNEMKSMWEAEKNIRDKVPKLKLSSDATPKGLLRRTFTRLNLHFKESNQDLHKDTVQLRSSTFLAGVKDVHCGHKTSQECLDDSCQVYRTLMIEEKKQNENKVKLQQALERKKRVEQRIEEQKKKTEKYLKELKDKQDQELERAMNNKKEKNEQIKQKMLKQNEMTRHKLEEVKSKKLSEKELSNIEENMKATLSVAELKAKKMKEEEASKIGKKLQMKIEKAQQAQKNMEEELRGWQEQAMNYRQQQDKHAEKMQAIQLAQKKEAMMRNREAKERAQKENLQRIMEREKEWRSSVEESILNKDEKRKFLTMEKESLLQKSRAQAQLTRRLRDDLKLNQSLTDLDKLSKYVDLQRKILS